MLQLDTSCVRSKGRSMKPTRSCRKGGSTVAIKSPPLNLPRLFVLISLFDKISTIISLPLFTYRAKLQQSQEQKVEPLYNMANGCDHEMRGALKCEGHIMKELKLKTGWSWAFMCNIKTYVTRLSTECYFIITLFVRALYVITNHQSNILRL